MSRTVKQRVDQNFEVVDGGQWVAGPFTTHAQAVEWIEAAEHSARLTWQDLPDDLRKTAKIVETTYLQRRGVDLAKMIAIALAEERQRCRELALGLNGHLIKKGDGLYRKATFHDLAEKIGRGDRS